MHAAPSAPFAASFSGDKRDLMRDPLMPQKTAEQSRKQKRFVFVGIFVLAALAGLLAAVTYEPRERTYSVEVPVEIEYTTSPPVSETSPTTP